MNILIVEDNQSHLKLTRLVLAAAGHNVSSAEAADEALGLIQWEKPQVILLDLGLPTMDGLALVRQLKSDLTTRHIPIVAITAYPERFGKQRAMQAGCDEYLTKPVSTRLLPALVEEAATRAKTKAAAERPPDAPEVSP